MGNDTVEKHGADDEPAFDFDLHLDLNFDLDLENYDENENLEDDDELDEIEDEEEEEEEKAENRGSSTELYEDEEDNCGVANTTYDCGFTSNISFECDTYEALAARKRKALEIGDNICNTFSSKKIKQDQQGVSQEELMEVMNFGLRRRRKKSKEANRRGRQKGSKNKRNPDITRLLGEATILYVHERYKEAVSKLHEVIVLGGNVPEAYHTLALVHDALGNTKIATELYTIVASLARKDSSLWRLLFIQHMNQGNVERAIKCLSRAISDDRTDSSSRVLLALIYEQHEEYQKAVTLYEEIVQNSSVSPEIRQAVLYAVDRYHNRDQIEQSVRILEEYIKHHPDDLSVKCSLVYILMETKAYGNALEHIEHVIMKNQLQKELANQLKIKAGICHLYLGNLEKAEVEFSFLRHEKSLVDLGLIIQVADAFMDLQHINSAIEYYHILEPMAGEIEGCINMKIAQCSLYLGDRGKAMNYLKKALEKLEDTVDARLMLSSLLLEENQEEEAIALLSNPNCCDNPSEVENMKEWWNDGRIRLKLSRIFKSKGMAQEFVDTLCPVVREVLYTENVRPKVKVKKRLTESVLRERSKLLEIGERDGIFGGVRPLASQSDLLKARRARKMLQQKEGIKDFEFYYKCDDSDDETLSDIPKIPPLLNFLKDEDNIDLIIELCKAMQSLKKYWEALEIIDLTRRLTFKNISAAKKVTFQTLAAQISYCTTDPKHGYECLRSILLRHPLSFAAWNNYYKVVLRLGKNYSRHGKFLRRMRLLYSKFVPPYLITGHQFTMGSHHQDAAREYLEAFKLSPDNPLVNLCVGTALINLALGFRLQNKHDTVIQGLSFLFNNLKLGENVQEAYYNLGRACHHVGLVTHAVFYYEKVLQIRQQDCSIPKLLNESSDHSDCHSGHCDLRREAAYNLHLIYKTSGAFDLARQILKGHCSF